MRFSKIENWKRNRHNKKLAKLEQEAAYQQDWAKRRTEERKLQAKINKHKPTQRKVGPSTFAKSVGAFRAVSNQLGSDINLGSKKSKKKKKEDNPFNMFRGF